MRIPRENTHLVVPGVAAHPFAVADELAKLVFPLVRGGVGYDLAKPLDALARMAAGFLLPWVFWFAYVAVTGAAPPANRGNGWLLLFVTLCTVASFATFLRRSREVRSGQGRHSLEAGWSWLTLRTPLAPWLSEIVLTPALFAIAGYVIQRTFSFELGWLLIFCGIAYAWVAQWEMRLHWRKRINAVSDTERAAQFGRMMEEAQAHGAASTVSPSAHHSIHDTATVGAGTASPAAASWRAGSENAAADVTSWIFRRRKPARGTGQ